MGVQRYDSKWQWLFTACIIHITLMSVPAQALDEDDPCAENGQQMGMRTRVPKSRITQWRCAPSNEQADPTPDDLFPQSRCFFLLLGPRFLLLHASPGHQNTPSVFTEHVPAIARRGRSACGKRFRPPSLSLCAIPLPSFLVLSASSLHRLPWRLSCRGRVSPSAHDPGVKVPPSARRLSPPNISGLKTRPGEGPVTTENRYHHPDNPAHRYIQHCSTLAQGSFRPLWHFFDRTQ